MATKEIQHPSLLRAKTSEERENILKKTWNDATRYLKGVNSELKRVSWPTAQELRYNTVVVVIVVVAIASYMFFVDQILNILFRWVHRT